MLYRFTLYALIVIFLVFNTAHAEKDYAGMLVFGNGELDRLTSIDADPQPIRTGQVIHSGDIIRTGANGSAAILAADESLIRLRENTVLNFEHVARTAVWLYPKDRSDGVSSERSSTYQLMTGGLWLRNKSEHFVITVNAAHLNATLNGTELDLLMLPEDVVVMTVQEGLVTASNALGSVGVKQWEKIFAYPGKPLEKQLLLASESMVQWTLAIPFLPGFLETPLVSADRVFLKSEKIRAEQAVSQDPDNRHASLRLAAIYGDLGLLTESEVLFKDALRHTDMDEQLQAETTTGLAWIYIRQGHTRDALKLLLEEKAPGPENLLGRSIAYAKMGKIQEAKDVLASALTQYPDFIPLIHQSAKLLITEKKFDAACDMLGKFLEKQSDDAFGWSLLGLSKLILGEKDIAAEAADKGIAIAPNATFSLLVKSYTSQARFHYEAALATTRKILEIEPSHLLARVHLAQLRFGGGYIKEADRIIQEAVLDDPENALVQNTLGFVRLARRRPREARRAFEATIKYDASMGDPHLGLALIHMRKGDEKKAMQELSTAVLLEPNRSIYLTYWAKMLYQLKRSDEALDMLDKAAVLDPHDPSPLYYISWIKNGMNRPTEAIRALQKAIQLNDNRAIYRSRFLLDQDLSTKNIDLADVYNRLGLSEWATSKAVAAVKQDVSNCWAHFSLGTALLNDEHPRSGFNEVLLGSIMKPANQNSFNTFNSYSSFFEYPEMHAMMTGEAGSQDTYGGDVYIYGWLPRFTVAYDIGAAYSQKYGVSKEDEQFLRNGYIGAKWDVTENDHLYIETSWNNHKFSHEMMYGEKIEFFPDDDHTTKKTVYEVGLHHRFSPGSDLVVYTAVEFIPTRSNITRETSSDYESQNDIRHYERTFYIDDVDIYLLQVQQMIKAASHQLTLGGFQLWANQELRFDNFDYFQFQDKRYPFKSSIIKNKMTKGFLSLYVRDLWQITERLMFEAALHYDQMTNIAIIADTKWDVELFEPRLGIIYSLSEKDTLRLAGFRYLTPFMQDRIDSPEIAGIPIFRFAIDGTIIEEVDVVWEHEWESGWFASGLFYMEREEDFYIKDETGNMTKYTNAGGLKGIHASLNQLILNGCGLAMTYRSWETHSLPVSGRESRMDHMGTIGLKYLASSGFSTGIKETYRYTEFKDDENRPENIFITDVQIGYELQQKRASVNLVVENLFDETFNWISNMGLFARTSERQWFLTVEWRI